MRNGSFLSYKRRRTRKKKGSRVERTKCYRSDSGRFSLCFLLHSFSVQGFEEARAVSRNARVRPAAPPPCSPSVCVEANRHRHLFAALFAVSSLAVRL